MKKTTIIGIALLYFACFDAVAQLRTYSNEFLSLGVGARGLAMGNAQVASTNDITAGFWNPAGLTHLKNVQVGAMHAEWFAGIGKYDYLSIAAPFGTNNRVLGATLIRFGVDDIPNTLFIVDPDGSVDYEKLSTFSAADYALLLSYAQSIKERLTVGANVKIIHRRVGKFATSWGFGLDVGAQYQASDNFILGLTIKDLTTTFNAWSFNFTEEEKLALEAADNIIPSSSTELTGQRIIFGGAYYLNFSDKIGLLAELDADITIDGKRNVLIKTDPISLDPHLGFELSYDQAIFLRAGLNNIQEIKDGEGTNLSIQPNLGIGLRFKSVMLDYAFTNFNNVSDGTFSHVFSLKIDFDATN